MIDKNNILAIASNERTYQRGMELSKKLKSLDIKTEHKNGFNYYTTNIAGTIGDYDVRLTTNNLGDVINYSCTCLAYETYDGACKHIVALVDKVKDFKTNEINLLKNYIKIERTNKIGDMEIIPTIFYSLIKNEAIVEFKIGREKKYIIKNIKEFLTRIQYNDIFRYGKELELKHDYFYFTSSSQKIINYLKEYCPFINEYDYNDFRYLRLNEYSFKKLITILKDEIINIVIDDENFSVRYTKEVPKFKFVYQNQELKIDNFERYKYISINNTKYLINDAFLVDLNEKEELFVSFIEYSLTNSTYFNSDNIQTFFLYVYPKIKDEIEIKNLDALIALNTIADLKIKVYLDYNNAILKAQVEFYYDGIIKDEAIKNGIITNEYLENEFMDKLYDLGFVKALDYYAIKDDNKMIEFMQYNKVELLQKEATVFVSESFNNFKVRRIESGMVGVRFENNLLEILYNDFDFPLSELKDVLKSYRSNKNYHLLKDGSVLRIDENIKEIDEVVELTSFMPTDTTKSAIVPNYIGLELKNHLIKSNESSDFNDFIDKVIHYQNNEFPLDDDLDKIMRDYQKDAFKWLMTMSKYELGGILADDMGLGKTLETISLLKMDKSGIPSLVITPASLVYNWVSEIKKFTNLNVLAIVGNFSERMATIAEIDKSVNVIITSYDLIRKDIEAYHSKFFHYVIIDEAQNIKNFNTLNAKSVKRINASVKFALTGTPLENSLADLWSIFDYILPNYLKSYPSFKNNFELDIIKNGNKEKMDKLIKIISPFILRRRKKEVLKELPEKTEQVLYANMDENQKKLYQAMLFEAREKLKSNAGTDKLLIFQLLTRLRQAVCHPKLFLNDYTGNSAKFDLAIEKVKEIIHSNHKVLLFSQFTSMLELIREELDNLEINYKVLTGDTKTNIRLDIVNEFNESDEPLVFLISLKAGGVGLNLTSADYVIHFDPWWNFSVENQATDRTHRIGQKNKVTVLKLIVKDSIEEKVLNIQEKKKELFNQMFEENTDVLNNLTTDELYSLLEEDK